MSVRGAGGIIRRRGTAVTTDNFTLYRLRVFYPRITLGGLQRDYTTTETIRGAAVSAAGGESGAAEWHHIELTSWEVPNTCDHDAKRSRLPVVLKL